MPMSISGAFEVVPVRHGDSRGHFSRLFCAEVFGEHGLEHEWVQVNTSFSRTTGSLRGLHFQRPPSAEVKLVTCLRGAVQDIILDLRDRSATFGAWQAVRLSSDAGNLVYIPKGCAHGFQTLTDDCQMLYFHDTPYAPDAEAGVHHADPAIGIDWPLPVSEISDRDRALPPLSDVEPLRL